MSNSSSSSRALALCLVAAAAVVRAESVPFVGVLDITSIVETGAEWRVSGQVTTYPPTGYSGLDVPTNSMLGCEYSAGTLDLYEVTAIVTQTAALVELQVAYDGAGSPSAGAPTYGRAMLCESVGGIPLTADYLPQGVSPFLRDALRWVATTRLAAIGADTNGGITEAEALVLIDDAIEDATNVMDAVAYDGELDPVWAGASNLYARTAIINSTTTTVSGGVLDLGTVSATESDPVWSAVSTNYGYRDCGVTSNLSGGVLVNCGSTNGLAPGTYLIGGAVYQFNDLAAAERLSAAQLRINGVAINGAFINELRLEPYPAGTSGGGFTLAPGIGTINSVTDVVSIVVRIETDSTTDAFTWINWSRIK